jgi:hypothetical protein
MQISFLFLYQNRNLESRQKNDAPQTIKHGHHRGWRRQRYNPANYTKKLNVSDYAKVFIPFTDNWGPRATYGRFKDKRK